MDTGTGFEDDALGALRLGWDDLYEFGLGLEGYWARRRDGIGETMIDCSPERVRQLVQDNYALMPGLRGPARQA